jgi:hypothetical protein
MGGTNLFLLGWAMWSLLLVVAFAHWSEILFGRFAGRRTRPSDLTRACVTTALVCLFLAVPALNKLHLFWLALIIIVGGYWFDRRDARRRSQSDLHSEDDVLVPVQLGGHVPETGIRSRGEAGPTTALSIDVGRIVRAHVVIFDIDAGSYGIAWTLDDGTQGTDLIGPIAEAEAVARTINAAVFKRLPTAAIRQDKYAQTGGAV